MTDLFLSVFGTSVSVSVLILLLLLISPLLQKRYAAKWKYLVWCVLAVRLSVPFGGGDTGSAADLVKQWRSHIAATAENREEAEAEDGRLRSPRVVVEVPQQMTTPLKVQTGRKITALDVLACLWAAGCVLYILINIFSYLYYRRRVFREGTVIKDAAILQQLLRCKYELHIKRTILVMEFYEAPSPMLVGFLKPVLILPEVYYDRVELSFILRHELVHYRRKDTWCKLLFMLAAAVHWFNPLVWIMQREAAVDMELACDEKVVQGADFETRKAYTETLLSTLHKGCDRSVLLSTGFYGGKKIMKKRFQNILSKTGKRNGLYILACTAILAISAGTLMGCSLVKNKEESIAEGAGISDGQSTGTAGELSGGDLFAQMAGSWIIDFDRTDSSLWGTGISYGDGMEIAETGAFSYYIGIGVGGTGQCVEAGGAVTVEIDPYEEVSAEKEILSLAYGSENGVEYILMDWHDEEVYWKRGELPAAENGGTLAGNASADVQTAQDTITLTIMKEGMPEEKTARLVVENGYILYLPDGEWEKVEADMWCAAANANVLIWVAGFESGYPIEQILTDDGYTPDETGMVREEGGIRYHVRLYEAETGVWCVSYSYPVEAEEGWGRELPVIADTFAVLLPGEHITETGALSAQVLGYISAFDDGTVTIDRQDWVTPESPDWKPEYDADAGFEIVDLEGEDVTCRIRENCTYHALENHQGESVELSREEFVRYWQETNFPIFWSFELEDGEVKSIAEWYLP
ncbi:MAG: M56 family metallopeptidase [Lachnospiraceae bacterium]|nr:M56 family metallopeptidase [Lachnospiraceae bacterium]